MDSKNENHTRLIRSESSKSLKYNYSNQKHFKSFHNHLKRRNSVSKRKSVNNQIHPNSPLKQNKSFKSKSPFSPKKNMRNMSFREENSQTILNNNNIFIINSPEIKNNFNKRNSCFNIYINSAMDTEEIIQKIKKSQLQGHDIKININKTENPKNKSVTLKQISKEIRRKSFKEENYLKELEETMDIHHDKSGSSENKKQHWKKVSNLVKCLQNLNNFEIKVLPSDNEFEKEINEHQDKISRKYSSFKKKRNAQKQPVQEKVDDKESLEMLRISLKEKCMNIILNGHPEPQKKLNYYFSLNPDRFSLNERDPNFLFNQLLSNQKNLFYIACREGNKVIVKYFLEKKLNPYIKSMIDGVQESPLETSVRWGYDDIVELLLDQVVYSEEDIRAALSVRPLKQIIKRRS